MLKRTLLSITALFLMGGCAKATLIDQTMNAFTASASEGFDDRITIKWITNAYYTSYQVIRSETENGTYIPVSTPIATDSFDDTTTPRGVPYYYKVRGFNNIGIPLFTTVKPARGVAGEAVFTPPTTLTVSQGESSARIFLRWQRAKNAVKYKIYRETSDTLPDGSMNYVEIGETSMLEYEDTLGLDGTPMGPGQTYYYKITAVNSDDVESERYPFAYKGLKGSTLGGFSGFTSDAGSNPDYIELTWNPLSGVKNYIIYRSTDKAALGDITAVVEAPAEAYSARALAPLSYKDHSAEPATVYYYTIFFQGDHALSQIPGEKVKSYRKASAAPATPTGLTASQGTDPTFIRLEWDPVPGATTYEISRSANEDGPWEELELTVNTDGSGRMYAKDNPYADASVKSFSYYYRVTAGNPALGLPSSAQQGWANRPPMGIKASKLFGGKIVLSWDAAPGATRYLISYSETKDGVFSSAGSADTTNFTHELPLVTEKEKSFYYKVSAETPHGLSFSSDAVEGKISKMVAPQNFKVRNNASILADGASVVLSWDRIASASGYKVYRAALKHRFAEIKNLRPSDYKLVATPSSPNYQDPMSSYPLRRYVYKVVGVDFENAEGEAVYTSDVAATADKTVYRLPRDTMEFMRDVDKTIIEAQTRISGFGNMGSSGSPMGRAGGQYIYSAGTSAVNNWANFTSFEITLSGATSFSVNINNMTATQSGTVTVSGLYGGSFTYNGLVGALGGYTTGGSITVRYNGETRTYDFTELDSLDNIVRTTEPKPSYPSYEEGGG